MPTDPLIIQPGALRHKITIKARNNGAQDSIGQPIAGDWVDVLTTRASIVSTLTSTYKAATSDGTITTQATDIITIRWPGSTINITPDMQVTRQDQTFEINAIDNVNRRNRVVKLYCMTINTGSN